MKVKNIIQYLLSNDRICDRYSSRVAAGGSKAALAEMICSSDGGEFICSEIASGVDIDYKDAAEYFASHFNGKRVFTYDTDSGKYTSELYCGYRGTIEVKTTLVTLLGCHATIVVPNYAICHINCDSNTDCEIICEGSSSAVCLYWGKKPHSRGNVKFIIGD